MLEEIVHVLDHFDNGRYTWRHNKVLKEDSQSKFSQNYIVYIILLLYCRRYISCERAFHYPTRNTNSFRDILAEANDWTVAVDLEVLRHYPQLFRDSGRRPDVVLASLSSDAFILVELTVSRNDKIEASNVLKTEKLWPSERSGG